MQSTTEIRTYRVTWSIDVEATSANGAALDVARDYLQAGHTATVFNVALTYFVLGRATSPKAIGCCLAIVLGFMLGNYLVLYLSDF